MLALIIIGVIVLLIALILIIPVGADIGYENGELKVSAKACGVLMQLYPKPQEEEKNEKEQGKKKEKKEKKAAQEEPAKVKKLRTMPQFSKEEMLELAKAGIGAVGKFGRKLKVDRFLLHYTAAGKDPYNTAVTFGYVNAALSCLAPICAQRFTVKNCSVWTDIDFVKEKTEIDFGLAMSIRIGQIMAIVMSVGFKALGIMKRNKARLKAQTQPDDAKQQTGCNKTAEPEDYNPVKTENLNNTENIQAEERKDSNG